MKLTVSPFLPGAQVVAYLRDSGGDEQELSIPQQEQTARAWCAENQLSLARVYSDSASGAATAKRKEFLEMIHDLHHALSIPISVGGGLAIILCCSEGIRWTKRIVKNQQWNF